MGIVSNKRPTLLKLVCILGFIWVTFSFPGVFSPSIKKLGDWYPALFGLLVSCNFISFIGVWHMKQWGVHLFAITFFIREFTLILIDDMGIMSILGIIFSLFFLISMLVHYKKMDKNL